MRNMIAYPRIMQPDELRRLNEDVFEKLRTPIFFATPEPARPTTQYCRGRLYEVVTGLYIIYHDHGMQFLKVFLDYCNKLPDDPPEHYQSALTHYFAISDMRGAFCHGQLNGGGHERKYLQRLNYYVRTDKVKDAHYMRNEITDQECMGILRKIVRDADRFMSHIMGYAAIIGSKPQLAKAWRQLLVDHALNPRERKYGKGPNARYFDERLVYDLKNGIYGKAMQNLKSHTPLVQKWLTVMEPVVLAGNLQSADELQQTLAAFLRRESPNIDRNAQGSSAGRLLGDFDI